MTVDLELTPLDEELLPFPSTELNYNLVHGYVKWSMDRIEVDGIVSENPHSLVSHLFFSVKYETDVKDNPTDTGTPWRWLPNLIVSEKHFLKCDVIIPEGAYCLVCGER